MELKDFIRETLVGIAKGVEEARIETGDIWAINPTAIDGEKIVEKSYVEFDIAVTAGETTGSRKEGKGGVRAEISVLGASVGGDLGGGLEGSKQSHSENVSRVSFKVPVHMNVQFRSDEALKQRFEYFAAKDATKKRETSA